MRKILLTILVLSISFVLHSQNENPFAEFGYSVLTATSSKGDFEEFHDQTDIVEIGSILYNTQTKEIVKVLEKDETTIGLSSAITAMSIDPLCEKYYWISPYAYCANNPIRFVDPDGMDWVQRTVDGVDEYYYDRSVTSQSDVDKKYGEKGGVTHLATGHTVTKYNKDGSIKSQYTFSNDAKENKYGTVTNKDGQTLDNSKIEYGKDFTIFGTSDNSVNAETLHKNYFGTSYIGPNNPKKYVADKYGSDSYQYMPRNASEYPAMMHDKRYDAKGARGKADAFLEKKVLGADVKLTIGSVGVMINPTVPMKDRARAAAVAVAFGNISTAKFLMAIW